MTRPTWLVIPAYNEERSIDDVVTRSLAVASHVIVVDDGSTDGTAAALARHAVRVLRHPVNRGKGAALLTGMTQALNDDAARIVTLDADGQHRPEDVGALLAAGDNAPGAIIVGSRRADGRNAPRTRYWANRIADFWISWAAGAPIEDSQSGFRLYPAAVLRRLLASAGASEGFALESELLIEAGRAGVPIVAVAIPALYGDALRRASHFRPIRDIPIIIAMVAWKLLSWGMYPSGLWRLLTRRAAATPPDGGRAARSGVPSAAASPTAAPSGRDA